MKNYTEKTSQLFDLVKKLPSIKTTSLRRRFFPLYNRSLTIDPYEKFMTNATQIRNFLQYLFYLTISKFYVKFNNMPLQNLINGEAGVSFAKWVAKSLPPKAGFHFAHFLASLISKNENMPIVRSARANQWIVSGKRLTPEELKKQVQEVFVNTGYCLYDFYHLMNKPEIIREKVILSPKLEQVFINQRNCGHGTIYLTPHLSNFDLAGRAIAYHGYPMLVLSYPNPHKGYQMQNKMRQESAIEVMPMSVESLRLAKQRLLAGEAISTGLDRPLAESKYHPRFFSYPSMLPVTYVKLALQTNAKIIVVACVSQSDGHYRVESSDLITMDQYDDPIEEMERNAEKVLIQAEHFISAHPEQWSMFYPIWPWALDEMPQ